MLLKKAEKKPVEEIINTFDWPENYYMETDPEKRKKILDSQNDPAEEEVNKLRRELFDLRYKKEKNGKMIDRFLGAWMEFLIMKSQLNSVMAKRRLRKDAIRALDMFGIPQVEHFGKDLLMEELKHAVLLYCYASQSDRQYNSIIFGFGKKKKEDVEIKIKSELLLISEKIPEKLEMVEEMKLLTEAIELAKEHMGFDK